MKRLYLFVCLLVSVLLAGQAQAKTAPKVYELIVPKAGWIEGFDSGSSEIKPEQKASIWQIISYLSANPQATVVLEGSVSDEIIRSGKCSTSADGVYFYLDNTGSKQISGERACEQALGYSRAKRVGWVIEEVHKGRVKTFSDVYYAQRPGGHEPNRSVAYWYVNLPASAVIQGEPHQLDNGDLQVKYILQPKTLCQKITVWWQENVPKPHFRFQERVQAEPKS